MSRPLFAIPDGWRVERARDAVVLARGEHRIAVHHGLSGAPDLASLVAATALERCELVREEHFVTCEGEHALLARGRVGSSAIALGFVFLDDTYVRALARAPHLDDDDALARGVRELVQSMRLFLGETRRRRCRYAPPLGWRAIACEPDDTWLAPDYPTHRASITVARALPVASRDHVSMVRTLLELDRDSPPPPSSGVATPRGLTGERWLRSIEVAGAAMDVVVVCARASLVGEEGM